MLVLSDANLAFLAVPKTGTTAIEMGLRGHADVIITKRRKHLPARKFRNKVQPFLQDAFDFTPETVAVMREPTEQIRSWYRYRSSPRLKGGRKSTEGRSFDEFVQAVIQPDPPHFAGIGSQFTFLTDAQGNLIVDHLFSYEAIPALRDFFSERLKKEIEFKPQNVSPPADAPLSDELAAKLRMHRQAEYDLYDRLTAAGGYLGPA